MKHRTADLSGSLLDAAVAIAEGDRVPDYWRDPDDGTPWLRPGREEWHPSERWDQGGPIIERERVCVGPRVDVAGQWVAYIDQVFDGGAVYNSRGATPLEAAMRAYVASKLGDEVDLP